MSANNSLIPGLQLEPGAPLATEPPPALTRPEFVIACPKCACRHSIMVKSPEEALVFNCPSCRAKLKIRVHPSAPVQPKPVFDSQIVSSLATNLNSAICPSCLKRLAPGARIDQGWATCSDCGDKFLAQSSSTWKDLAAAPSQGLKLKGAQCCPSLAENFDSLARINEVTVLDVAPGKKRKTLLVALVAVFLVVLVYGHLILSSFREAETLVDNPTPAPKSEPTTYTYNDFTRDLLDFRHWARDKRLKNYIIEYSGHSSRLFKYAIAQLAPDKCQEFTSLSLSASKQVGVSITGQCFHSNLANPTANIQWRGRSAIVTVADVRKVLNVEIYPTTPPAPEANAF